MADDFDVGPAPINGGGSDVASGPRGPGFGAQAVAGASPPEIERGGLPGWRLRRVVDYMTQNLARDIDVNELVTRCGLSRAQFFRAFRQSTGQTPHRYLVGLRLDAARGLLESTTMAVADVARAVGMGSNAGFARLFRERFGEQPARYRRAMHAARAGARRRP